MQDWSHFVTFDPKTSYRPTSIAELEALLTSMAGDDHDATHLRVLGSLHSCSRICDADSVLDVSALPKTLEFAGDGSTATISANHSLHECLDALAVRGMSLAATGGTYHQTLAGLISTSTAPATPNVSMYDALEWVEYVTLDRATKRAVVKSVSRGEPTFRGIVCSLGALGVITRVRFKLIEQPFFEATQRVVEMQSILGDLDATSAKYDFWRVNWIPDSDKALLWAARRIPADQANPTGDYEESVAENILAFVFKQWDLIAHGKPGPLLDPLMEAVYDLMAAFYNIGQKPVTGPLRNLLPVDKRAPLRVAMAEWSFAPSDLDAVLTCCRKYFDAQGWPNIPTEIELSKTDDYLMSPWNWPGLQYVVKFNFMYLTDVCKTDAEKALISKHLRGLWQALLHAKIRFKAHWAKINFLDHAFVSKNHELDKFLPLVDRLFVNSYLRERLFATASAAE